MNRDWPEKGMYYFADTDTHSGINCYAFLTVTATVINAITYKNGFAGPSASEGAVLTGVSIPAGLLIQIPFTSIDLTSGSILAYRNE